MNLSDLVIPPWVKPALCAVALLGAFSGGWTVRRWKDTAAQTHALQAQQKQFQAQLAKQGKEAAAYENDRQAAREASEGRQQTIRTIYKDRVVPGDCAAPDAVRSVLQDGVRSANSQARGEPVAAVPATTGPAGRPD